MSQKINRISELEKKYLNQALNDNFSMSTNGEWLAKFETSVKNVTQTKYAISFANCTAALHSSLLALNLKKGAEVLVPSLTYGATAMVVLQAGFIPVFVDIDKNTLLLDEVDARDKINKKTGAVIVVSIFGLEFKYSNFFRDIRKKGIKIIEDNAEFSISKFNKLKKECDIACFSFQASKHLTSGHGGVAITNNKKIADNLRSISALGFKFNSNSSKINVNKDKMSVKSRHSLIGYNYRLADPLAAILLAQIERGEILTNCRIEAGNSFQKILNNYDFVTTQEIPKNSIHTFWTFPIIFKSIKLLNNFKYEIAKSTIKKPYAPWAVTYDEPLFKKYKRDTNKNSEYINSRMLLMPTGFWDKKILKEEINELQKILDKL